MDNVPVVSSIFNRFKSFNTRFDDMTEMMSSGVELMFAGMGIVFLFLTMLVVAINIMSSLVQRFFPDAPTLVAAAAGIQRY